MLFTGLFIQDAFQVHEDFGLWILIELVEVLEGFVFKALVGNGDDH